MTTRRVAPWAVLTVIVIVAVVWAAGSGDDEPSARQRLRELTTELRCPDCEGLSVADSPTTSARAIRTEIELRIAEGDTDEEIRQSYVDRYGESILLKPEGSGLGLLVWGLPVFALLVGGGGLVLALRRWRREPRMHATDADEALVGRARSK